MTLWGPVPTRMYSAVFGAKTGRAAADDGTSQASAHAAAMTRPGFERSVNGTRTDARASDFNNSLLIANAPFPRNSNPRGLGVAINTQSSVQ